MLKAQNTNISATKKNEERYKGVFFSFLEVEKISK